MKEETIKRHLENENLAYETWYLRTLEKELGLVEGKYTGVIPPIKEIKKKFQEWETKNYIILQEKICKEWGYKKMREKYDNNLELAVLVAEQISQFSDFPYEIAIILVLNRLDELCL